MKNEIKIFHSDMINYSPAGKIIIEAQYYLDKEGFSGDSVQINSGHPCIYAQINKETVGIISYYEVDKKYYFITQSYVKPEHRKKKVYSKMWKKLVEISKKNKIKCINGMVDIKNKIMQEVMDKFNRKAIAVYYEFKI